MQNFPFFKKSLRYHPTGKERLYLFLIAFIIAGGIAKVIHSLHILAIAYHRIPLTTAHELAPNTTRLAHSGAEVHQILLDELQKTTAEHQVYIAVYRFTDETIATACINAYNRGTEIHIMSDSAIGNSRYKTQLQRMKRAGIDVCYLPSKPTKYNPNNSDRPPLFHHKWIVIQSKDETIIGIGSYNFTHSAATKNYESMLFVHNPELGKELIRNWYNLLQ